MFSSIEIEEDEENMRRGVSHRASTRLYWPTKVFMVFSESKQTNADSAYRGIVAFDIPISAAHESASD